MMIRFLVLLSALIGLCLIPTHARNGARRTLPFEPWKSCPPDTDGYSAWLLTSNSLAGDRKAIPDDDIFEVTESQKTAAISLLSQEAFVKLSPEQSYDLTGGKAKGRESQSEAFLIRNVVPDFLALLKAGPVRLEHIGTGLQISAGLFGCGGFKKNPLVVYLASAPSQIDMQVSAIW
jgi:hypothetical protein